MGQGGSPQTLRASCGGGGLLEMPAQSMQTESQEPAMYGDLPVVIEHVTGGL